MSGSHSSSDDSTDSRKRPPEEVLCPDSSPKRANCDDVVHLKVLIPSIAAGAVIGKGGEAIGRIQKETNTKVKISKQDEFYPGTTERVCLIVGSIDGVMCVNNYIMDRIMEKPDPNPHTTCEGRLNVERHKQVKILVPNSTAGMVIGKGGSYIQEIKDKTGAYVQISQKSREFNLLERCIIIAGDLDQTRAAVQLILAVIAADPQSASCPNLSYHDIRGPVASVYPTGSPYATPVIPCPINPNWFASSTIDPTANAAAMMAAAMLSPRAITPVGAMQTVSNTAFGLVSQPTSYATTPDLSSLTTVLTASNPALGMALTPTLIQQQPSASSAGNEPVSPVVPPVPFTLDPSQFGLTTSMVEPAMTMSAAQQAALLAATAAAAASFRPKTQVLGADLQQLAESSVFSTAIGPQTSVLSGGSAPTQPPMLGLYAMQNTGSPQLSSNIGSYIYRRTISVPENMIGLILGPQGRSVADLQVASGTTIQISQKGVFAPGTHSRIVTITGPPLNVQWIASVIEQRISVEQLRRESMSSSQSTSSPLLFPADADDPQRKQAVFFNLPVTCATFYSSVSQSSPAPEPKPSSAGPSMSNQDTTSSSSQAP